MKEIRQRINECKIPRYMQDILTNNYCPYFLRMSMLHENEDYTFNYQLDRYKKLDIAILDTEDKLTLIKSIVLLKERNEKWLIGVENYLIDPELVYSIDNRVDENNIRILFYPDFNKLSFKVKMLRFVEKIKTFSNHEEIELLNQFKVIVDTNDWNRAKLFLDKNILRMATRGELVVQ